MDEKVRQLLIEAGNFISAYADGGGKADQLLEQIDKILEDVKQISEKNHEEAFQEGFEEGYRQGGKDGYQACAEGR